MRHIAAVMAAGAVALFIVSCGGETATTDTTAATDSITAETTTTSTVPSTTTRVTVTTTLATTTTAPTADQEIPSDWLAHTDEAAGFSIRYPSDWEIGDFPENEFEDLMDYLNEAIGAPAFQPDPILCSLQAGSIPINRDIHPT